MKNLKDKSKIPYGEYCYDNSGVCPYHSYKKDLPDQYNGFCSYIGKSDIDLANESELTDLNTGEKVKGSELPFPVGMLWDQCKECNENMSSEDNFLEL